jgi:hypothetical protein
MKSQVKIPEISEKRLPLTVVTLAWPVVMQEAAWSIMAMEIGRAHV